MEELGCTGVIEEFNDAARLKKQFVPVPIFVTTNGTILAGFGRWQSALFDDRHEINCIEYSLISPRACFGLFAPRALGQTAAAMFVILGQEQKPRPKPRPWVHGRGADHV
jgi:hypothetical protein